MAKRVLWSEEEALLLLDAYDLICKNPMLRSEIVGALSINLRRRATDSGMSIDGVFRNNAGINMRLQEISKLIDPSSAGLTNTSALFRDMVDLFLKHRRTFLKKVQQVEEYRARILPDMVSFDLYEAAVLLDGYLNLSAPGENKAHMARLVSARLRTLAVNRGRIITEAYRSPGGIEGRFRKMDIAFTGNVFPGEVVPQIFDEVVNTYRSNRGRYKELLQEANGLIGKIILPEDAEKLERIKKKERDALPVNRTKYVKTKKDRSLKEQYPKAFVAVYDALLRSYFTDPKGVTATNIFQDLKQKYLRKDIIVILAGASWAEEKKSGRYVHTMGEKIMATQDANERKFFSWLEKRISKDQYANLYKSKGVIVAMLLSRRATNMPLFLIEEEDKVLSIRKKTRSCFANGKMRSNAELLLSHYAEYLREKALLGSQETQQVEQQDDERENDEEAIQNEFSTWLTECQKLSGPTCRSYISGIRSSERFAAEHHFVHSEIFTGDKDVAFKTIEMLLTNREFVEQHASYRPYLRKYLQYLGVTTPIQEAEPRGVQKQVKKVDADLVKAIEAAVKAAPIGIQKTELRDRFTGYSDNQFALAMNAADIIPVLDKCFHRENIEDFDSMADILLGILSHQFNAYGGYTSDVQLYKEAQSKLDDFFFYNGAFDSRAEVYDLAMALFDKIGYKNHYFVFRDRRHIWKVKPDYSMDFGGLLIKYGREHGNTFSREEAISHFEFHGSGTPAQTLSLILNRSGRNNFLQYSENRFVLAEAMNVSEQFLDLLRSRIEALLEGGDYVALGDISDFFYNTLPALPTGVSWGPLLLQSILGIYDIGYITISAGSSNDLKTIDAALLRKKSILKTFADVVWCELSQDYNLPHTFSSEEFRTYLLEKGFIHGMEKTYSVHKTVEKDLRFLWTAENSVVTVSKA